MKALMTGFLVASSSILLFLPASSQENVGGRYDVSGKNMDGSSYSGTAEITITSGNTCRIAWQTGGSTSSGICMRNGTPFTAAYDLGGKIGLVIYEIKRDGAVRASTHHASGVCIGGATGGVYRRN